MKVHAFFVVVTLSMGVLFLSSCSSAPEVKELKASLIQGVRSHQDAVATVKFSPDGKVLASGSWDNTIKLWKVQDTKAHLIGTLTGHTNWVLDVAFSPINGKYLASASADSTVKIWDWKKSRLVQTLSGHTRKVVAVSFSSDGKRLASASEDGTVKIWSMAKFKLEKSLSHPNPVLAVAFSPNGNLLVCGDSTGKFYLYDGNTLEKLDEWEAHSASVRDIAFREDGKFMVSVGDDKVGKLWEVEDQSLSEYTTLYGHKNALLAATFSPEGKIATAGKDRTVRIWDEEGNPLQVLSQHRHWVYDVTFNADGTLLASSTKELVNLWDLQNERFISFLIDSQLTGR